MIGIEIIPDDPFYDLWEKAIQVPELGGGGRVVGPRLVQFAEAVPAGHVIVETGPWLGSTTVFLALGSYLNPWQPIIHSYDPWRITPAFAKKAFKYNGLKLRPGQSVKGRWRRNVKDFPVKIVGHQGSAYYQAPPKNPIGLLVDDCTTGSGNLGKLFDNFGPTLAIGAAVVMMDYYFVTARPEEPAYHDTVRWFALRDESFSGPVRIPGSTAAVFRYRGGL